MKEDKLYQEPHFSIMAEEKWSKLDVLTQFRTLYYGKEWGHAIKFYEREIKLTHPVIPKSAQRKYRQAVAEEKRLWNARHELPFRPRPASHFYLGKRIKNRVSNYCFFKTGIVNIVCDEHIGNDRSCAKCKWVTDTICRYPTITSVMREPKFTADQKQTLCRELDVINWSELSYLSQWDEIREVRTLEFLSSKVIADKIITRGRLLLHLPLPKALKIIIQSHIPPTTEEENAYTVSL